MGAVAETTHKLLYFEEKNSGFFLLKCYLSSVGVLFISEINFNLRMTFPFKILSKVKEAQCQQKLF